MESSNMIMIYYWDKKLTKRLHVLEADIIKIKKNPSIWYLLLQDAFFTGRVPNDRHCAGLSIKLSY